MTKNNCKKTKKLFFLYFMFAELITRIGRCGQDVRVRLFVSPKYNSKRKDSKLFKLGIGNDLRTMFWGFKVTG